MIGIAIVLVVVVAPLLYGMTGAVRIWWESAAARVEQPQVKSWRLTFASALLYVLAFNLTFFIQELFLVLPKAMTPGLRPRLFHNNHNWEGDHPLAHLFQGTGALAILISGVVCALIVQRRSIRSPTLRLFLVWMTFTGMLQALPQVVVGSLVSGNDVGMAMGYLGISGATKTAAALVALAAIPPIAMWLTREFLSLADDQVQIASARARVAFVWSVATLPAILAIPMIIPFRVPREWIEVAAVPVISTAIGIAWIQATAWHVRGATARGGLSRLSAMYPLGAVLVLLAFFQLVLRPGIRFF